MNRHAGVTKGERRLAAPMVAPASGLPLIKSVPSLGKMLVWRKGRSTVDADMPLHHRKEKVRRDFEIFVEWMFKEDKAEYVGGSVKIAGPFPHFEAHEPDTQVGDRGGRRKVARSIAKDTSENGKEDYVIECLFRVPEHIQEVPTDLAVELFDKGRPGIKPLRQNEWKQKGTDSWSPRG